MANTTPSPNLGLPVPTLTDQGPDYATNVNTCLNEIDAAIGGAVTGVGSAVVDLSKQPTTGNISVDGYNLSNTRSIEFANQPGNLTGSQDVNCLYVNQNNLGFNNDDGYFVPITNGNTIAITSLPFTNLTFALSTVTTNTVIAPNATYNTLNVNTSGGPVTITLPVANLISPTPQGRCFFINDIDGYFGTNNCTIQVSGGSGNLIVGGNLLGAVGSFPLNANGQNLMIYTDGVNHWYTLMYNQFAYNDQTINYTNSSEINMDDSCGIVMPGYFLPNNGPSTTLAGLITVGTFGPDTGGITFATGTTLNMGSGAITKLNALSTLQVDTAIGASSSHAVNYDVNTVAVVNGTNTVGSSVYNSPIITLTGTITADATVVLPSIIGAIWYLDFQTMTFNSHTLNVQVGSSSPLALVNAGTAQYQTTPAAFLSNIIIVYANNSFTVK